MEKLLDARAALEREVGEEEELRRVAQPAPLADLAAQVARGPPQRLAGLLALLLAAEAGEVDARRLQIRRHLDVGDRDPRRSGSCASIRTIRASSARTRSATRWLRRDCFFISLSHTWMNSLRYSSSSPSRFSSTKRRTCWSSASSGCLVGADRGDPELRPLQEVLVSHLGRGDLELVADPALEALDDHPLFFQPPASRKVDVEDGVGEDHEDVRRKT